MSLVEQFEFAPPFWTPERKELLRSMNEAGHIDRSIAKAMGVSKEVVLNQRLKLGIPPIRQKRWGPDFDEHIDRLRNEGKSASLIARELTTLYGKTITRNAVIGRLFRRGLSEPDRRRPSITAHENRVRKPTVAHVRIQEVSVKEIVELYPPAPELPHEPKPDSATIVDVKGCRWPVQDHPYLFCDDRRADGSSYCFEHRAIAWRPAKKALGVE